MVGAGGGGGGGGWGAGGGGRGGGGGGAGRAHPVALGEEPVGAEAGAHRLVDDAAKMLDLPGAAAWRLPAPSPPPGPPFPFSICTQTDTRVIIGGRRCREPDIRGRGRVGEKGKSQEEEGKKTGRTGRGGRPSPNSSIDTAIDERTEGRGHKGKHPRQQQCASSWRYSASSATGSRATRGLVPPRLLAVEPAEVPPGLSPDG